jgi:outer membrane protein assembly factor BamB
VAISSGGEPRVAVLFRSTKGQAIAIYDAKGTQIAQGAPGSHAEQIEITPAGDGIVLYGNGPRGQYVSLHALAGLSAGGSLASTLKENWHREDKRYADYSSSIIVTNDLIIAGFEDVVPTSRQSHLLALDREGKLKWDIPLVTEEGAYLYAHALAADKSLVVVGTDDGTLAAYRVSP